MGTHYIQANTDGRLHPASEPSISPLNRGFLYGDAIYEVWRTYGCTIFAFEEHWQRLEQSARALYMELPLDRARFLGEVRRTVQAFFENNGQATEFYIRLQISRGAGAIGLDTGLADHASYVILVQPLKEQPEKWQQSGMRLSVATSLHRLHADTVNPAWKTGNYLNSILCLREARSRGADEVLMTNLAGEITEAAVSNLFFVRDQILITPPLSAGILAGVTRRFIIEQAAPRANLQVREETVRVEELKAFRECFLSSTTKEIASVAAIDEVKFAIGENGVAQKLREAFKEWVREYQAGHPELKIGAKLVP
ncbi:aminotransferase class IV [Pedosphaera parvula]|uniref:branched-chain-amino-acid transaminase n=1 Tax=Pedosphaera parvula (strain Ellin514) TaxID=320771 RepID=B9XH70_PEDPL|nr:aminotransferase class IV [Pedosphaera parvula]EEF60705.1 aminotransferase class IV [Pedosphaera parvula Ellin514]